LHDRLHDSAVIAGRLAHSFDNILTGILGFAELTLSQLPPGSAQYRYLSEVLQAAQQGTQLTQQLHTLSRCGTVRPGAASLPQVIGEEEPRWRSLLGANAFLHVTLPADLPPLAIDAETLRQVLTNVVDNARESLSSGGTVTLSARRVDLTPADAQELFGNAAPGPHIEVTVADTGSGLTADMRRRLLAEPFVTTKARHQGLGLAVVYRILHAYRGGFQIGPAADKGTVVRLVVPVVPRAG
jgi:signal transduction histidine kinase